mmetsp:Transcript_90057/g.156050  ORF Transcript_90057/g.156050 Transcript_90057/m.156050 type:complete len:212 (-) Transcript_90057:85-720(-)
MGCLPFVELRPMEMDMLHGQSTFSSATSANKRTLHVAVTKEEGVPLGIAIKGKDGDVVICSVSHRGMLKSSWENQHPGDELLPGYRIISANGVTGGVRDMGAELWKVGQIYLEVQKPENAHPPLRRTNSRVYLASTPGAKDFALNGPVDKFEHLSAQACGATECAVCFEELEPEDRVVQLPCRHAFHPTCIAQWFVRGTRRCPLCVRAVDS